MSSHLPYELVLIITEVLWNDYQSLVTCSQLNHEWLTASRIHMFTNRRFTRVLPDNMTTFLDLLRSSHSTFPTFLHTILIHRFFVRAQDALEQLLLALDDEINIQRRLHIRTIIFEKEFYRHWDLLQRTFSDVTAMEYTFDPDRLMMDVIKAAEFIASFKNLETLTLKGSIIPPKNAVTDSPVQTHKIAFPGTLRSLNLRMNSGLALATELFSNVTTLIKLRIYSLTMDQGEILAPTFIRTCLPTVTDLKLYPALNVLPIINLSCMPHLKSFKLCCHNRSRPIRCLTDLLQSLTNPSTLEHIELAINSYLPISNQPWSELDAFLATDKFSGLKTLTIYMGTCSQSGVEEGFPQCRAKKILLINETGMKSKSIVSTVGEGDTSGARTRGRSFGAINRARFGQP